MLWQAFIGRARLESFSLVADSAYISQSIGRIMRALFEICLKKSWCTLAYLLLQYAKVSAAHRLSAQEVCSCIQKEFRTHNKGHKEWLGIGL